MKIPYSDPNLNHSKLNSHTKPYGQTVLNKLDSQIFELLDEDKLANEIEPTDTFTNKIQLDIIDIDQVLKGNVNLFALEVESSVITTHTSPLTISTAGPSSTEAADVPKVKLPKLTLKQFNGDLDNLLGFFQVFDSQ